MRGYERAESYFAQVATATGSFEYEPFPKHYYEGAKIFFYWSLMYVMIYCIVQYQSPETKYDVNEICNQPNAFKYGYNETSIDHDPLRSDADY